MGQKIGSEPTRLSREAQIGARLAVLLVLEEAPVSSPSLDDVRCHLQSRAAQPWTSSTAFGRTHRMWQTPSRLACRIFPLRGDESIAADSIDSISAT